MRQNRKYAVIAALLALAMVTGCPKNAYRTAAKLGDDVGASVNAGATMVDGLRKANAITPGEERSVLGYITTVNTFNGVYLSCVAGAHASGDIPTAFAGCADSFLATVKDPVTMAELHISNPNSQRSVQTWALALQTTIDGARAILAGFKGGN